MKGHNPKNLANTKLLTKTVLTKISRYSFMFIWFLSNQTSQNNDVVVFY